MTIVCWLWAASFIGIIVSAVWARCPLWVPCLLMAIAGLLGCMPLR